MCKRRVDACSEPDFLAVSGRAVKVPSGRAARLAHLGGLSLGMMGNVAGQGLKELGSGRRPALPQLLMSPQNISLLARKLAKMAGWGGFPALMCARWRPHRSGRFIMQ